MYLLLGCVSEKTRDDDIAWIERDLLDGLDVTYEYDASLRAENTWFSGSRDQLETVVWRYVTPLDRVASHDWTTADTASDDDKQDFEHFANIADTKQELVVTFA
jgi:hypothetical protein